MDKYDKKELENSKRIFKSATPKYELSWYIKWGASVFIMVSMSMRGIPEYQTWDLILSTIGVSGWLVVGMLWHDRALILLNGVAIFIFASGILNYYYG